MGKIVIEYLEKDAPRINKGFDRMFNYDQSKKVVRNKAGEITSEETIEEFVDRQITVFVHKVMVEGERPVVVDKAVTKLRNDVSKIDIKVKRQ